MGGYYDIHTHILPGVDDGSKDISMTTEMLKAAWKEGIQHIIATPHFDTCSRNPEVQELYEALELTREAARRIDKNMTVSLGNEILNSAGAIEALKSGRALTLGETRYVLIEFLPDEGYTDIYNSLHNYIINGFIPVLAHMERYAALAGRFDYIEELIQMGVALQMNSGSLTGGIFNRKAAYNRKLVEGGYIHFIASDCHDISVRPPAMSEMLRQCCKSAGNSKRYKNLLIKNPERMLADEYL